MTKSSNASFPSEKLPNLTLIQKQNKQIKCKKKQAGGSTKLPPISIERANLKQKQRKFNEVSPKNHKTIKRALSPKRF